MKALKWQSDRPGYYFAFVRTPGKAFKKSDDLGAYILLRNPGYWCVNYTHYKKSDRIPAWNGQRHNTKAEAQAEAQAHYEASPFYPRETPEPADLTTPAPPQRAEGDTCALSQRHGPHDWNITNVKEGKTTTQKFYCVGADVPQTETAAEEKNVKDIKLEPGDMVLATNGAKTWPAMLIEPGLKMPDMWWMRITGTSTEADETVHARLFDDLEAVKSYIHNHPDEAEQWHAYQKRVSIKTLHASLVELLGDVVGDIGSMLYELEQGQGDDD